MLHYFHVEVATGAVTPLLAFQLRFLRGVPTAQSQEGGAEHLTAAAAAAAPINQPWTFEFVPGAPGELLLLQEGSSRLLYAALPRRGEVASDVFLFGTHSGMHIWLHSVAWMAGMCAVGVSSVRMWIGCCSRSRS